MPARKQQRQSGDADANQAIRHGRGSEVRKEIAAEMTRSKAAAEDIAELCLKASRISQQLPLPARQTETKSEDQTRT